MRVLRNVGEALTPESRKDLLHQAGDIVADEMRRLAPVLSGDLRSNIVVSADPQGVGRVSQSYWASTVYVGPARKIFYAHMVELGTSHSAPNPFMRVAVENTRDEVRALLATGVWSIVKSAARR